MIENFERVLLEGALTLLNSKSSDCACFFASTEAEAQKAVHVLRSALPKDECVLVMPAFTQAGVYRYESAKKIIALRVAALNDLGRKKVRFVVTTPQGLHRLSPGLDWIEKNNVTLKVTEEHDLDLLLEQLEKFVYQQVQQVEDVGEFAVRGGILDVWPPGQEHPVRIEFFGDEIKKIRTFKPVDQRSFGELNQLQIIPAREFVWPGSQQDVETQFEKFNDALLQLDIAGSARMDLLENLKANVPFAGIDDIVFLYGNEKAKSFVEILKNKVADAGGKLNLVSLSSEVEIQESLQETVKLYEESYASAFGRAFAAIKHQQLFPQLSLFKPEFFVEPTRPVNVWIQSLEKEKISSRVQRIIKEHSEIGIGNLLFLCDEKESLVTLESILSKHLKKFPSLEEENNIPLLRDMLKEKNERIINLDLSTYLAFAHLETCFLIPKFSLHLENVLVISQSWLQGAHKEAALESYGNAEEATNSREAAERLMSLQFGDFTEGDFVVHVQHGVGKFLGIKNFVLEGISADFLAIEYSSGDKIYVPIHKLNLVHRYVGGASADNVTLDNLRGTQWEKKKEKAHEEAKKIAKELMEHQAKRAVSLGHVYASLGEEYFEFESAFPYEDTEDQKKAVKEIMMDMSKPKPMDRVLCGDVGFGKTEVAMRAAYRAVLDGKQVAWLVPTTILAQQHYRSLKERLANFSVRVEVFDRAVSSAHVKRALVDLKLGKIDIAIGTHRLLSADVGFRDLGLLVIDEEHRFGVQQKELIKKMSYGVAVLSMTATPIPRTLQMSILGLKDLSLLTTPPKSRLAVKTFVCPFEEETIKAAIEYECARGGQVFYVHNRVEPLTGIQDFLKTLLPNLRICIGHGKMNQKDLEKNVIDFLDKKYDLFLCTTIIESGIDMPNVNTIIVQDADHFGLAQLYQLRGRVGRRATRGYTYFLHSPSAAPESEGLQRLKVLSDHQHLGSGFVIASHDLENRGAGNLLGEEQTGKVTDVGLETYLQMLDDAIRSLGGQKIVAQKEVEMQIPVSGYIPETYVVNPRERMRLYRRFFGALSETALSALQEECRDRFGDLPIPVTILTKLSRIRRWLLTLGAVSLSVGEELTELRLSQEVLQPKQEDEWVENLIKRILEVSNRMSGTVRLMPDGRILMRVKKKDFQNNSESALHQVVRYVGLLAGEAIENG